MVVVKAAGVVALVGLVPSQAMLLQGIALFKAGLVVAVAVAITLAPYGIQALVAPPQAGLAAALLRSLVLQMLMEPTGLMVSIDRAALVEELFSKQAEVA